MISSPNDIFVDNKNADENINVIENNDINIYVENSIKNRRAYTRNYTRNRKDRADKTIKRTDNKNIDETLEKDIPLFNIIYRYKFTELVMEELYQFSKIHQYDERNDFKEAWQIWVDDNKDIIQTETIRLANLGYHGDIRDKMFKSARYYFRKKSTTKKDPKTRKVYVKVAMELLEVMDKHIAENMSEQPKLGFINFCNANQRMLKETFENMDTDAIQRKIKKAYKNRYYLRGHPARPYLNCF